MTAFAFIWRSQCKYLPTSVYEMIDAVEPDQAYQDEVDGDDVVQEPRNHENQNAGDKGDDGSDVIGGDNHFQFPKVVGMIQLAASDTASSCRAAEITP